MNIQIKQQQGTCILPITQVKSISAVSQCNIIVTKTNGEQITGILAEVQNK